MSTVQMMSDFDALLKKLLRAVLQSNKDGVSITRLQSDYRSLTGEFIPHKQLGYPSLEAYLRSMPSVVRMENCLGEVKCFAVDCQEKDHIAWMVPKARVGKRVLEQQGVITTTPDSQRGVYDLQLVQHRISLVLMKYCSGLWLSKLPAVYKDWFNQEMHGQALIDLEKWTHVCSVEKPGSTNRADRLIYPPIQPKPTPTAGSPIPNTPTSLTSPATPVSPKWNTPASPPASPVVVPADVRAKLKELLSKYSQGLWAHALPKLFMDTYKTPFPTDVLANLSLLLDICTVEYPLPDNKDKAILYSPSWYDQRKRTSTVSPPPPSGIKVSPSPVPTLKAPPRKPAPFLLVVEVKNASTLTIRYSGEGYSPAQEALEDRTPCSR